MKRRQFAMVSAGAALAAWANLPAQAAVPGFELGTDYLELKKPVPTDAKPPQIEVIEFFSYGCPHCMHFEPILSKWSKTAPKNVALRFEHVGFNAGFAPLQKIYYSLKATGQVEKLHAKAFTAYIGEKLDLTKPDVLFAWVAKQGGDRQAFEQAYNSFGVANSVRRANQLQADYAVEGTPALGIAGRYYTDSGMTRGFERMLQLTDALVAQMSKRG